MKKGCCQCQATVCNVEVRSVEKVLKSNGKKELRYHVTVKKTDGTEISIERTFDDFIILENQLSQLYQTEKNADVFRRMSFLRVSGSPESGELFSRLRRKKSGGQLTILTRRCNSLLEKNTGKQHELMSKFFTDCQYCWKKWEKQSKVLSTKGNSGRMGSIKQITWPQHLPIYSVKQTRDCPVSSQCPAGDQQPLKLHLNQHVLVRHKCPLACLYIAMSEHIGESEDELSFSSGECLLVLQKQLNGWWTAKTVSDRKCGIVPAVLLKPMKSSDAENDRDKWACRRSLSNRVGQIKLTTCRTSSVMPKTWLLPKVQPTASLQQQQLGGQTKKPVRYINVSPGGEIADCPKEGGADSEDMHNIEEKYMTNSLLEEEIRSDFTQHEEANGNLLTGNHLDNEENVNLNYGVTRF